MKRRRILRRMLGGIGATALLIGVAGYGLGSLVFAGPHYEGPPTDHFDGRRFFNLPSIESRSGAFFRWIVNRQPGPWPDWVPSSPGAPPPNRIDGDGLRVTFINHATVLVQMDGINVLTDPIWSDRASPVPFIGPKRHRAPGLRFEDLPPIDVVLVSHNHYDHCDVPTLRRLARAHHPRILAGLGNDLLFRREGIDGGQALDWGQSVDLGNGVRITSVQNRHFSGRGLSDRNATLWTAFLIEGRAGKVLFAGDTGYGPHFRAAGEKYGPIRLAILPIGAFLPRSVMAPVHISPAEAVQAQRDLRAATAVAMHFGTFRLADDGMDQPAEELARAVAAAAAPRPEFWVLGFGEGREVPALEAEDNAVLQSPAP